MAAIPKVLHEHIDTAFPAYVCLVGTVLPNGYAQITPRGSTMVYDDEHFALWERGKGSTNASLRTEPRSPSISASRRCASRGCCRRAASRASTASAKIHKSGPIYEEIWQRLVQPEKDRDPEKKGFGVLIKVERAEDSGRSAADDLMMPQTTGGAAISVCSLPLAGLAGEGVMRLSIDDAT